MANLGSLTRRGTSFLSVICLWLGLTKGFSQKSLSSNGIGKNQSAHNRVLFTDSQAAVLLADGNLGLPSPLAEGNKLTQPLSINEQSPNLFDAGIMQVDRITGTQKPITRGEGNFVNPRGVGVLSSSH
jgi:hypothetical protein